MLDSDGCITTDFHCLACEYNLHMLPATGRCPECGRPIEESLRFVDLRWAPHRWVDGLEFGTMSVLFAHVWFVITVVSVGMAPMSGLWGFAIVGALAVITLAFTLTGTTLLSRPDPRTRRHRNRLGIRQCVRYGPVLASVALAAQVWVAVQFVPTRPIFLYLIPSLAAAFFGPIVSLPALYRHMSHLMRGAKDAHLADASNTLSRVFLVLGALTFVGVLVPALSLLPVLDELAALMICGMLLVGLGYLLCGVAGISVLYESGKVLATVAADAREHVRHDE